MIPKRLALSVALSVAASTAFGVGGGSGIGGDTIIITQQQLYNLMDSFNISNPTNMVNQAEFFEYLTDTTQTQQNLVDGDITEEELTSWWIDNPSGIS